MSVDATFAKARPFLRLVGAALIAVAAAKLFGFRIGVPGTIEAQALVGLGLMHV